MRIRQYVYFRIKSETVSAAELARLIGLEPDRVSVKGSRSVDPVRPVNHSWEIVCDTPGLTVDEQIDRVVARLTRHRDAIRRTVTDIDDTWPALQVVRYLGAGLAEDDGEDEDAVVTDDGLQRLPGQHQLLGWYLSREVMRFLLEVDAAVDIDEYG